jgi:hypothetical protein
MQNWLGPLIETVPSHPDLPDDAVLADAAKGIKLLCESALLRFTVGQLDRALVARQSELQGLIEKGKQAVDELQERLDKEMKMTEFDELAGGLVRAAAGQ